jgi:hypothetical protein
MVFFFFEDLRIPLVPKIPRDDHDERRLLSPPTTTREDQVTPPVLDVLKGKEKSLCG